MPIMIPNEALNWRSTDCLFSAKDMYLLSHDTKGRNTSFMQLSKCQQRRYTVDNMHLLPLLKQTANGVPIIEPFNEPLDFLYVSYEERKKHDGIGCALGFFLYDYKFIVPLWHKLEQTTRDIIHYQYVFAPDISLYAESFCEKQNKNNIYRARFIAAYWQYCGIKVIPVATWGGADSFCYCFEGLPKNSVIAVCGIGHDHNPQAHRLWCHALRELERQKKPTTIIVYGGKLCEVEGFNTPLMFIPDYITKHFRK